MLVLTRRHKSDGKRLNLGIVDSTGMAPGHFIGMPVMRDGFTPQIVNAVEPLHTITAKDDTVAVDGLLYLSGASNFKTVEI